MIFQCDECQINFKTKFTYQRHILRPSHNLRLIQIEQEKIEMSIAEIKKMVDTTANYILKGKPLIAVGVLEEDRLLGINTDDISNNPRNETVQKITCHSWHSLHKPKRLFS